MGGETDRQRQSETDGRGRRKGRERVGARDEGEKVQVSDDRLVPLALTPSTLTPSVARKVRQVLMFSTCTHKANLTVPLSSASSKHLDNNIHFASSLTTNNHTGPGKLSIRIHFYK